MNSVNNLNIFTFIKDIYQSLKHIDKTMTLSNDDLNKRISKLEDNQQILLDKLTNIEILLTKLGDMTKPNSSLDKTIEFELLEKMKRLNKNEVNNSKIALKPNELTFANILENNYEFNDINQSLGNIISDNNTYDIYDTNNTYNNREDTYNNKDIIENTNNTNTNNLKPESLDTLLF